VKASELYQEIQNNPPLRVGVEIMVDAMNQHNTLETPLNAIMSHGEDQAHRCFYIEDFDRIVENHLLQAPLNISKLTALAPMFHFGAMEMHLEEGYVEITELGWKVGAYYMIGRMDDPEAQARSREEQREKDRRRQAQWEAQLADAREKLTNYALHGGSSLQEALDAILALAGGTYGWEVTAEEIPGRLKMELLIHDVWELAEARPAPEFDYGIIDPYRDTPAYPGLDYQGQLRKKYRPDLMHIFIPLWDGLAYYLEGWRSLDFHKEITLYDYWPDSLLEQSMVYYFKTDDPISLRVANQMADLIIENMLEADSRWQVRHKLMDLEMSINRLSYLLRGMYDYQEKMCKFIGDLLNRYPFLREEIPIINDTFNALETYEDRCSQ